MAIDLGFIGAVDQPYLLDVVADGDISIDGLDAKFESLTTDFYMEWSENRPLDGRFAMNVYTQYDPVQYLQVESEGAWTITVLPWTAVETWSGGEAHGVGPDVLLFDGEPGTMSFAHHGDGDFIVDVVLSSNYAVEEIGTVEGTTFIKDSPSPVLIHADGEWWLRR